MKIGVVIYLKLLDYVKADKPTCKSFVQNHGAPGGVSVCLRSPGHAAGSPAGMEAG